MTKHPTRAWPDGHGSALSLTFDVDADTMWTSKDPKSRNRPSVLSLAQFDVGEGLENVLSFLGAHQITATFFVPSSMAIKYSERLSSIVASGHEIACHGTDHVPLDQPSPAEEARMLHQATSEIESALGVRPIGYRAPLYSVTEHTNAILKELGYAYSSNLMSSVHPFIDSNGIVELPVHWALDDGPYFLTANFPPNYRVTAENSKVREIWTDELEAIADHGGVTTLTLHPQLIGRPSRIRILDHIMTITTQHTPPIWCTSQERIAAHVLQHAGVE